MFPLLCYNQSLLFQNKKEEQHGLSVSTSQFSTYEDNRCLNILKNTKQYNYESSPWDMEYGTSAFMKISLTHLPFMKLLPKKQSLENVFPSIQRGGWHVREETQASVMESDWRTLRSIPVLTFYDSLMLEITLNGYTARGEFSSEKPAFRGFHHSFHILKLDLILV